MLSDFRSKKPEVQKAEVDLAVPGHRAVKHWS